MLLACTLLLNESCLHEREQGQKVYRQRREAKAFVRRVSIATSRPSDRDLYTYSNNDQWRCGWPLFYKTV